MKKSKRMLDALEKVDKQKLYELEQALELLESFPKPKFDETVEICFNLGVDTKKSDQQIRSSLVLPHGTGKKVKVLAIADGDKADEARKAGADYVGSEEIIEKIKNENWLDYDVVVALPSMMSKIGKVARILGPRGLMPNPKVGTVSDNMTKMVTEVKAGKITYKADKFSNVHMIVGKRSFSKDNLRENILTAVAAIIKDRPSSVKGIYMKNIYLSATMSPGIKLNVNSATMESKNRR